MRAKSVYAYRADSLFEYQKAVEICIEISRRSYMGDVKFGPLEDKEIMKTGLMIYGDNVHDVWSFKREFEIAVASKKLQLIKA